MKIVRQTQMVIPPIFPSFQSFRGDEGKKDLHPLKVPKGLVIYAPEGQAGEYAALATNPYEGCGGRRRRDCAQRGFQSPGG